MRNWFLTPILVVGLGTAPAAAAEQSRHLHTIANAQPRTPGRSANQPWLDLAGSRLAVVQGGPIGIRDTEARFAIRHCDGPMPAKISAWVGTRQHGRERAQEITLGDDGGRLAMVSLELPVNLEPDVDCLWIEVAQPWGQRAQGAYALHM